MDSAHRKIELQSSEDLTFLINNVRRAATEHVTAAFPPVEGQDGAEEDELRVRIEKLVEDYISQTFTLAAPNLSINGFDLDPRTFPSRYLSTTPTTTSPSPESGRRRQQQQRDGEPEVQYEAFDARKRARVEELARDEEDLMREIAALKRRVPAAAARAYSEGFWEGVGRDEEALARAREHATRDGKTDDDDDDGDGEGGAEEEGGGGDGGKAKKRRKTKAAAAAKVMLDGVGPLERQDDVERSYRGVVGTLSRLKRDMPATVARMERARVAGQYVVTER
ncbi:hypothetical protein VPNG_06324 [Cytospora leucostoma]|uniref:Kinetochore protein mis14 n=1 Tax=Cytospora leucostoma TaxID=1230097 RepID=A0A423X1V3_9PEZI|nr:hypothetical protein VPNG_06324 [Cytospora leucostoma]